MKGQNSLRPSPNDIPVKGRYRRVGLIEELVYPPLYPITCHYGGILAARNAIVHW